MTRSKRIPVSTLEKGPIRPGKLPDALVARVTAVAAVFREVEGSPVAEWLEDFRRDAHPENEVATWELMAAAYTLFIRRHPGLLPMKKEAFQLLLARSMAPTGPFPLAQFACKHLSPTDAAELLRIHDELSHVRPNSV